MITRSLIELNFIKGHNIQNCSLENSKQREEQRRDSSQSGCSTDARLGKMLHTETGCHLLVKINNKHILNAVMSQENSQVELVNIF